VTDVQLYTAIGVPIIALIFAMVANFSLIARMDKRIDDMRDMLRAEIQTRAPHKDLTDFRADMAEWKAELRVLIERNHSEVMLKLSDLDHRVARLEGERRVIS
jgi:hypothetical protein